MTAGDAPDALARDAAWLAQLRAGDAAAFDAIYLRYYTRLLTFARQVAPDLDSAADLVQDVFVALWEQRARHTIVPPIAAYLYAAVRNRAISARRRLNTAERYRVQAVAQDEVAGAGTLASDPEQQLAAREVRAALRVAIDALPDRQRLALRLHLDDGLRPAEIARVMDIHEQVVRKLLGKAMHKLCAVLEQAEE